jgi:hypothetical protein
VTLDRRLAEAARLMAKAVTLDGKDRRRAVLCCLHNLIAWCAGRPLPAPPGERSLCVECFRRTNLGVEVCSYCRKLASRGRRKGTIVADTPDRQDAIAAMTEQAASGRPVSPRRRRGAG